MPPKTPIPQIKKIWDLINRLSDYSFAKEDGNLAYLPGLSIPKHDYLFLGYDANGNLISVVYKTGGSGGIIVGTLTLAYDANNNLISVTKS